MKQLDRDIELIDVILEDAQVLANRLRRFSLDQKQFVHDRSEDGELIYDAVMAPVYRIAEDTLHLSNDVVSAFPDYPWRQIKGFRNFVAHGYREIDRAIAWQVAGADIPELARLLRQYRDAHAPQMTHDDAGAGVAASQAPSASL